MTNWPYLFPGASKSKSEPNLFPLTLKVEAYKVVSDFDFEAQGESSAILSFCIWKYLKCQWLGGFLKVQPKLISFNS